jgi:hypothetical protein
MCLLQNQLLASYLSMAARIESAQRLFARAEFRRMMIEMTCELDALAYHPCRLREDESQPFRKPLRR